jgi:hypothetical protein
MLNFIVIRSNFIAGAWKRVRCRILVKKFLASILAFLYLSTSMGATIHLHYCMGKLISWGLMSHESGNCDYCGMSKNRSHTNDLTAKKNCCKDDNKQIKTAGDQKLPQAEYQFLKFSQDAPAAGFLSIPSFLIPSVTLAQPTSHAPPIIGKQPAFLLNCNFRI